MFFKGKNPEGNTVIVNIDQIAFCGISDKKELNNQIFFESTGSIVIIECADTKERDLIFDLLWKKLVKKE